LKNQLKNHQKSASGSSGFSTSSGFFSQKSATHKAVARKKSLPKANNKNLETELNEYSEMNVEDIDLSQTLWCFGA
jgi:hypothetical protein